MRPGNRRSDAEQQQQEHEPSTHRRSIRPARGRRQRQFPPERWITAAFSLRSSGWWDNAAIGGDASQAKWRVEMFNKALTAAALAVTVIGGLTPTAAMARHWDNDGWRGHGGYDHGWRGGHR